MITKVFQSRTGKNGNCFSACLASVLGLKIKDVPEATDKPNWVNDFQNFLKPMNLGLHWLEHCGSNRRPNGISIGAFIVPGKPYTHAIVCNNGRKIHDPFPKRKGLVARKVGKIDHWYVFTILDITKPVTIKFLTGH